MSDELSGLAGPVGLGPGEKVPPQVRILAAGENLGTLRSAHRPSHWLGRVQFRSGRVYVFDRGLVLAQRDGASLKLFPAAQIRVKNTDDRVFQLLGPQGRAGFVVAQWSEGTVLAAALAAWAQAHPW